MAGIEYAGQKLLILTPEVNAWLQRRYPIAETVFFSRRIDYKPQIRYPDPPPYRINQLYWPTGACRFGWFIGLAGDTEKDKIVDAVRDSRASAAQDLTISSSYWGKDVAEKTENSITVPMHLMPPRRISSQDGTWLWYIPLVDQRYWWRMDFSAETLYTRTSTWADLFDDFETQLGITITNDTIDADFQQPDPASFNRYHQDLPSLIDAACHAIGHRLIAKLDGSIETHDWLHAAATYLGNDIRMQDKRLAGSWVAGFKDCSAAEKVVSSFPRIRHYVPRIDGQRYKYEKDPAVDFSAQDLEPGTYKRIESTCYADFTDGNATPDNDSDLDALAAAIATAYYDSLEHQYQHELSGIYSWEPCSYDDAILWSVGRLTPAEKFDGSTRVWSMPPNLEIEELWQQTNQIVFDTTIKKAKTDVQILLDSSGRCSIWEGGADSAINVDGWFDWGQKTMTSISANNEVVLQFWQDEDRWGLIGWECTTS